MRTTVKFAKRTVRISNYYKCICGHNFTRKLSDWYTMNPFNNQSEADTRRHIAECLMLKSKKCPKCDELVKPYN